MHYCQELVFFCLQNREFGLFTASIRIGGLNHQGGGRMIIRPYGRGNVGRDGRRNVGRGGRALSPEILQATNPYAAQETRPTVFN